MFDWIQDLVSGIGDAISTALTDTWENISGSIWDVFMRFLYSLVYNALSDFFMRLPPLTPEPQKRRVCQAP